MWPLLRCLSFALVSTLTAVSFILLCPAQAYAWGPGVHMVAGNWVLQNLGVLPPEIARCLMEFPGQFLHGSLSPDIFIGKGCRPRQGHSHNWQSGLALLERAATRRHKAYAYGYLAHLAADTVAHNIYVPSQFEQAFGKGRLAHVYLEAQADRILDWDKNDALAVFKEAGSRGASSLLRNALEQKRLNFWLKRLIFKRSLAVGGSKTWRQSMQFFDNLLPANEREPFVQELLLISTRAVFNILMQGQNSVLFAMDPIGAKALAEAEHGKLCNNTLHIPELFKTLPSVCVLGAVFKRGA